jgi:hypothetical protein
MAPRLAVLSLLFNLFGHPGNVLPTRLLDAIRLGTDHDLTAVTAGQVREVAGGSSQPGSLRRLGHPGGLRRRLRTGQAEVLDREKQTLYG